MNRLDMNTCQTSIKTDIPSYYYSIAEDLSLVLLQMMQEPQQRGSQRTDLRPSELI